MTLLCATYLGRNITLLTLAGDDVSILFNRTDNSFDKIEFGNWSKKFDRDTTDCAAVQKDPNDDALVLVRQTLFYIDKWSTVHQETIAGCNGRLPQR